MRVLLRRASSSILNGRYHKGRLTKAHHKVGIQVKVCSSYSFVICWLVQQD